jgi:hypothetical protein
VLLTLLLTRNCSERILSFTYIAAEWTRTYSKHISRDDYPASLLAPRSDLQKTHLPLSLQVGPVYRAVAWQRVDQIRYIIDSVSVYAAQHEYTSMKMYCSLSIVTGYGTLFWFPEGKRIVFFATTFRSALDPIQPAKGPEHPADRCAWSPEVKNACSFTFTAIYIFITWCLIKHRYKFVSYIRYYNWPHRTTRFRFNVIFLNESTCNLGSWPPGLLTQQKRAEWQKLFPWEFNFDDVGVKN